MNHLLTTPVLVVILALLYIVFSVVITKYILSNGKSENQIIEDNKLKATQAKDFLKKYPEANLKSIRKFSLAFGFIFAFASSIYAFSLLGQIDSPPDLTGTRVEPATIFKILPPITTEKTKVLKKVVPPPPPSTIIKVVKNTTPEPPVIADPEPVTLKVNEPFIIEPEKEVKEKEVPVIFAEIMPRFKGCEDIKSEDEAYQCTMNKIKSYIATVEYPMEAYNNDIEGKVYVSFVIDQKGNVANIELIRGADSSLDKQSMKHIKKMPKFASAGRQGGRDVQVKFQIPIVFKLN